MPPPTGPRSVPARILASRLRFLLLFGLANAAAWWWLSGRSGPPEEPLRVAHFAPQGEAGAAERIEVTFNRDAAPPDLIPGAPAGALLEIEPQVPGRASWASRRRLVFEPARELPRGTAFRVVLSEHSGRAVGLRLEGTREFSFATERLKLLRAFQVGFTRALEATIRLEFNDLVSPRDLENHIELLAGDEPIAVVVPQRESAAAIEVRAQAAVDRLELHLRPGLRGRGPLGLPREVRTAVALTYRLRLVEATSPQVFAEEPEIQLDFNHPIDSEAAGALERHFHVEPPARYKARAGRWSSSIILSGGFRPGERYSVTALAGLPGASGAALAEDARREVLVPDRLERLALRDRGFLSPRGNRRLRLVSSNIAAAELAAHRLPAENLVHYLSLGSGSLDAFVRRGAWRKLELEAPRNELSERAVELEDLVGGDARGIWLVETRSAGGHYAGDRALAVMTDIALSLKQSRDALLIWATSLASGEPVARARVSLRARNNQTLAGGITDQDGLVTIEGPFDSPDGAPYLAIAELDGDLSYLEIERRRLSRTGFDVRGRPYPRRGYEAFLYGDRGIYRPGDTARLLAILRDARLELPPELPLELEVLRPDLKRLRLLRGTSSAEGSVSLEIEIPQTARTGSYRALLRLAGGGERLGAAEFLVEDFVPQRARLRLGLLGDTAAEGAPRRFRAGERIELGARGEHLAGLPAAGAAVEVDWKIGWSAFRPPGWTGFAFGDAARAAPRLSGSLGRAALDAAGEARFALDLPPLEHGSPLALYLRARLEEISGRVAGAELAVDVDPAPFYIGLRPLSGALGHAQRGRALRLSAAAVRPDGSRAPVDSLELIISRIEWSSVARRDASGRYVYDSHEKAIELERRAIALEEAEAELEVVFQAGGEHRLALVHAPSGVTAATRVWVGGAGESSPPRFDDAEKLEIALLPGIVRPGGKARVLVRSPFPGTLLLTTESDRVLSSQVLRLERSSLEIEVAVPETPAANLYVAGSLVRAVDPARDWAPHRAYGIAPLWIDRAPEHLVVTIEAPERLPPGAEGALRASVTTLDGSPRASEVAIFLADEGILSKTGYETPEPWSFFYGKRAHEVELSDIYGVLMPEAPLALRRARPGGDAGGEESTLADEALSRRLNPIAARRVRSAALFLGVFRTGGDGTLIRRFQLPATSGELRIVAIAHSRELFGSAEKPLAVRGRLHLELGVPRFAAPGDLFTSRADIFNSTAEAGRASVAWRFEGPLGPAGAFPMDPTRAASVGSGLAFAAVSERELELPAKASARLTFRLAAGPEPGRAVGRLAAAMGGESAEETVELPVRPAAPLVLRARSGEVTAGKPLLLELDGGAFLPGTARQRLVFSTLPELRLAGALRYLIGYPHGCLEQTVSRAFPLIYLRELAALAGAKAGGSEAAMEGAEELADLWLGEGIRRVLAFQSRAGWMGAWQQSSEPWLWGSAYAAHFLIEAGKAGCEVPAEELALLLEALEERLVRRPQSRSGRAMDDGQYDLERAYAAFVLALGGRKGAAEAVDSLLGSAGKLASEARFLLGAASSALGRREEARRLLGGDLPAASAERDLGGALRSPAREAALLLSVAIDVEPESPRVAALAERLAGWNVEGRWGNTQENAWALLALGKYARLRQGRGSTLTASVELGDREPVEITAGGSHVFEGDLGGLAVRARVEDEGLLYWSLIEEGVPLDGRVEEADSGLEVRRRYLRGERELSPGEALLQGEVVVVEITIASSRALENIAITDLLPAGLEVENPRLGGERPASAGAVEEARPLQAEHVEIRDDRVVIHASQAPGAGKALYRYAARAVTAGEFALPPIAAEGLYDAGIYSRHGGGRLVIAAGE
jgi:uncharacterized protein YfaS (alpha-2-macroglobulin family)